MSCGQRLLARSISWSKAVSLSIEVLIVLTVTLGRATLMPPPPPGARDAGVGRQLSRRRSRAHRARR
jgi:hypothetical protein